jgi:membrane-associated protease RseP (regulator of RpoE activity)
LNTATFENVDRLEQTARVHEALQGLMDIDRYAWDERGTLTLRGQLLGSATERYRAIRARMETLGFTPFLRRAGEQDELLAIPGIVERRPARIGLPVALFLATILSVLLTGALNERTEPIETFTELTRITIDTLSHPARLLLGLPFTLTLLGILFTHEMGHYIVARLRKAQVSLPYFIPLPPFISFTGTMGAVIVQREPMENRRSVLEIGIAGPLAGLVVAIPLLIYGLATSPISAPSPQMLAEGYLQEGNSLLYIAAKWLVFGRYLPSGGVDVQLNSVAMGAWIGLLVTMINMLPAGQLDGGHIAYALLGRRAVILANIVIGLCVVLGLLLPYNYTWLLWYLSGSTGTPPPHPFSLDNYVWLVWAVLAVLIGPRHPPPLDDISRLDRKHVALAIFGLFIFVLLLMPIPFGIVQP